MSARLRKHLESLGACEPAIEWAEQHRALAAAWAACHRGDRMLWYAGRVSGPIGSPSRRKVVLVATECARLAWPYVRMCRAVVQRLYKTAEAYGRGDPTVSLQDVQDAADGVDAPTSNAAICAAVYAATVARAASAAIYTSAAASAASAAAHAAAAARAAGDDLLRQAADIVRRHYPRPPRRSRSHG